MGITVNQVSKLFLTTLFVMVMIFTTKAILKKVPNQQVQKFVEGV